MYRRSILTLVTALICLGASSYSRADETLKFRAILHATFVESQGLVTWMVTKCHSPDIRE